MPGKRTLALPRLPQGTPAPRLDGDLSDPAWRAAAGAEQGFAVADKFSIVGGLKPAQRATRVLATYDDENLYVSFRCTDTDVVAKERARDDAGVFDDDCVELFFGCGPEDPSNYWHLAISPANVRWDALVANRTAADPAANLEWDSAAAQGEGYWATEIRIPFKAIRIPGSAQKLSVAPVGATWRVNLARQDKPTNESSSWSPVKRGFTDDPAEFGRWYFPR